VEEEARVESRAGVGCGLLGLIRECCGPRTMSPGGQKGDWTL
jgi:hypothetical protein